MWLMIATCPDATSQTDVSLKLADSTEPDVMLLRSANRRNSYVLAAQDSFLSCQTQPQGRCLQPVHVPRML